MVKWTSEDRRHVWKTETHINPPYCSDVLKLVEHSHKNVVLKNMYVFLPSQFSSLWTNWRNLNRVICNLLFVKAKICWTPAYIQQNKIFLGQERHLFIYLFIWFYIVWSRAIQLAALGPLLSGGWLQSGSPMTLFIYEFWFWVRFIAFTIQCNKINYLKKGNR